MMSLESPISFSGALVIFSPLGTTLIECISAWATRIENADVLRAQYLGSFIGFLVLAKLCMAARSTNRKVSTSNPSIAPTLPFELDPNPNTCSSPERRLRPAWASELSEVAVESKGIADAIDPNIQDNPETSLGFIMLHICFLFDSSDSLIPARSRYARSVLRIEYARQSTVGRSVMVEILGNVILPLCSSILVLIFFAPSGPSFLSPLVDGPVSSGIMTKSFAGASQSGQTNSPFPTSIAFKPE
mmetsp:Transcript_2222/g.3171  ORF Transcript_2222/g.3171 Transcript_2222/m.3171 type:complete len:245 (-) Transcript_2222:4791-5525(-)